MTTKYFDQLFDYDSAVNHRLLGALREVAAPGDQTMAIFAHLLASKKVWMGRLTERPARIAIWPELDFEACEALIEANREAYGSYFRDMSEARLTSTVQYQNSKGTSFENYVRDILMHVLTHGSYHRGQIAKLMRQAGHEPVNTGYIFHLRE